MKIIATDFISLSAIIAKWGVSSISFVVGGTPWCYTFIQPYSPSPILSRCRVTDIAVIISLDLETTTQSDMLRSDIPRQRIHLAAMSLQESNKTGIQANNLTKKTKNPSAYQNNAKSQGPGSIQNCMILVNEKITPQKHYPTRLRIREFRKTFLPEYRQGPSVGLNLRLEPYRCIYIIYTMWYLQCHNCILMKHLSRYDITNLNPPARCTTQRVIFHSMFIIITLPVAVLLW